MWPKRVLKLSHWPKIFDPLALHNDLQTHSDPPFTHSDPPFTHLSGFAFRGQKTIIQVSFDERGTPLRDPPPIKNQIHRVSTVYRSHSEWLASQPKYVAAYSHAIARFLTLNVCSIICRSFEYPRRMTNIIGVSSSSKNMSQCLPAPTPTRMAAPRTRDTPRRSFHPA